MSEEQLELFDGDSLPRRMSNSVKKLVGAHARLNARSEATQEDVAVAWEMLSYKLEVIRWICDDEAVRVRTLRSREEVMQQVHEAARQRWEQMVGQWGGQEVRLVEMAEELGVNVKTVGRDLGARGYYPEAGWCRVPTWAEEAQRAGEKAEPPAGFSEEEYHPSEEEVLDEDGEPVPVDPTPPLRLDPPGLELAPVLAAMRENEEFQRKQVQHAMRLVKAVVAWEGQHSEYDVEDFVTAVANAMPQTRDHDRLACAMQERLLTSEPDVRGLLMLQLVGWANWRVPAKFLREMLGKATLPERLRQGLESILARNQYWEEDEQERARQRIKEMREAGLQEQFY